MTGNNSTVQLPASAQGVVTNTQPNPRILEETARQARELVLDAATIGDAEPYAFGRAFCKPAIIGADDSGDTLVLDALWSIGECDKVADGAFTSRELWSPDLGYLPALGAGFEHFEGTAGQSASTIMTALKGSYAAYSNKAHSIISLQDGWNLNWGAFVRGVKVFDPRISPQANIFSENPALILADIYVRSGYTIDWDSVLDAADYADTPTHGPFSPMFPRWAVRGQITTKKELAYWVHSLAQHAGTYVDVRGGTAIFVVDKPRSSNHTVTASDKSIVAGTTTLQRRRSENAPDKVTINVPGPAGSAWSVSYGTSTGPGSESVLSMPFWENGHTAGLKAQEIQLRGQHDIEYFEFISRDHSLIRTVGDVGTITYAPAGLNAVEMTLVENEPVSRGRWHRKYIPYDAGDYPLSSAATVDETTGTVNNPYAPPAGSTPTLSFDTVTSASPNYDRIKIDFSPQTWAYLKDYKVTVTTTADEETILYSEYVAKGTETGSPETITKYTDFPVDFTDSPENVYRVNVYMRSNVSDGLTDVVGAAGTADISSPTFETTAKEFGGTSPENFYYLDSSSAVSPRNFSGFINSTGSGDTYQKMTLVFCINVQTHADAYFIAGSSYQFFIYCEADGSMVIRLEDWTSAPQVVDLDASASPASNPWPENQWRAFKIEIDNDDTTSPEARTWKIEAADVGTPGAPEELFNGTPGGSSDRAALNPHNLDSDLWVGHDGWDNDPALNCYASFIWCDESAGLAWGDFYDSNNKPKDLGATGENPTGSQPDFYAPDFDLTNNLGFGVDWLESGTVPAAPSSPTD